MRIDHIAIYTKKLDRLKSFYEYYFGGISNTKYKNKTTGLETYFISFQDGSRFILDIFILRSLLALLKM